jgi:hypothetical protein
VILLEISENHPFGELFVMRFDGTDVRHLTDNQSPDQRMSAFRPVSRM